MDKNTKRALKIASLTDPAARALLQEHKLQKNHISTTADTVHCACVIHGQAYSWIYVEKLYSMLSRHLSQDIVLHVYTEPERPVPSHMVKHALTDWQLKNSKKSWWYKMQMFNSEQYQGPLLYFDLDVVITANIDWICQLPLDYFWAIRDFKHLWRSTHYGINSSVMWWNTTNWQYIWQKFNQESIKNVTQRYHGDQDYLTEQIPVKNLRFFDQNRVQSWRWQAFDGGYDFRKRAHLSPGAGTDIKNSSILVFHGHPKPDKVLDPVIQQHWQ